MKSRIFKMQLTSPKIAANENDAFDLSKPTENEYKEAQANYNTLCEHLRLCRQRIGNLLDELVAEREDEKFCLSLAEKQKDIIKRYEIYTEIEEAKKKKGK